MEQTKKRGGRPPQKTTKPSGTSFKRVIPNADTAPKTYEVISGNDFILKISSKNVRAIDPETKRIRALRYCPQENSPWVDEQTNLAQVGQVLFDKSYLTVYPRPIKSLRVSRQSSRQQGEWGYPVSTDEQGRNV